MLFKKVKNWFTRPGKQEAPEATEATKYRYPPLAEGIPALPVEEILSQHRELLVKIQHLLEAEMWPERYWPIINRYAAYVHLLPASESHHHRGAGGLLVHGLEVGLYTLQQAYDRIYGMDLEPKERRLAKPRWQLGCFIAGLCHDLGKPLVSMTVTGEGGQVWKPFGQDLVTWCQANGSRYFVSFKKGEKEAHERMSVMALDRVLTEDDRRYLSAYDPDMMQDLLMAIQKNKKTKHDMGNMVNKADQQSVQEDLGRSNLAQDIGMQTGLPTIRVYRDIMRRLVSDGTWKVNEPGARLWVMDGGLYIVWPEGGRDIAVMLNRDSAYKGVPRDLIIISSILQEWQFIESTPGGSPYWRIRPDRLNTCLTAVKIMDPEMLMEMLPGSVSGGVAPGDAETDTEAGTEENPDSDDMPAGEGDVETDDQAGQDSARTAAGVQDREQANPAVTEMDDASAGDTLEEQTVQVPDEVRQAPPIQVPVVVVKGVQGDVVVWRSWRQRLWNRLPWLNKISNRLPWLARMIKRIRLNLPVKESQSPAEIHVAMDVTVQRSLISEAQTDRFIDALMSLRARFQETHDDFVALVDNIKASEDEIIASLNRFLDMGNYKGEALALVKKHIAVSSEAGPSQAETESGDNQEDKRFEWVNEINSLIDDGIALSVQDAYMYIPDRDRGRLAYYFKILPDGCLGRTCREALCQER